MKVRWSIISMIVLATDCGEGAGCARQPGHDNTPTENTQHANSTTTTGEDIKAINPNILLDQLGMPLGSREGFSMTRAPGSELAPILDQKWFEDNYGQFHRLPMSSPSDDGSSLRPWYFVEFTIKGKTIDFTLFLDGRGTANLVGGPVTVFRFPTSTPVMQPKMD